MKGYQEKLFFLIFELLAFVIPLYYFAVLFNHFKREVPIMKLAFFASLVLINLGILIEYLFNSKHFEIYKEKVEPLIQHKDPIDSLIDIANLKSDSFDLEIGKSHLYLETLILFLLFVTNLFLLVHSLHSGVQTNQLILVALSNIGFFIYSLGASYDLHQKAKLLKKAHFEL